MSKLVLAALAARVAALEQMVVGHERQRLTKKKLAEREGVTEREVDRRRARGVYRQPEIENRRTYWWSDNYRLVPTAADTAEGRAERNPQPRKPPELSTPPTNKRAKTARDPRLRAPAL